jgi:orotate phosphoribosyltransferase
MQESSSLDILKQKLVECKAVKFGNFTLTSGKKSKFYVDMKLASTDPKILQCIAKEFAKHISKDVDFIAGMELGAVPLAVALSLETGLPYSMIRKSARKHGTGSSIEGPKVGKAVLVDDVATTGGSNIESLESLIEEGVEVIQVMVVVDREEGAAEKIAPFNLDYKSLIKISDLVD